MDSLDLPGAVWDPGVTTQVSDVPMHMRSFSSVRQPVHLARALANHADIFQRILTGKQKIVLSGIQPGWHWLAHIDATSEGSKGYVSALYVDAARLSPDSPVETFAINPVVANDPVPRWLPATARRRFGHRMAASSQALTQHIYSVPVAAERVLEDVALGLASHGWQADIAPGKPGGPYIWSQKEQVLTLFVYAEPHGASVLVHHTHKATGSGQG